MPLLLILLIIVLVWMYLTYNARMRTRNCRWREDRTMDTPQGRHFVCVTCGAQTFQESNLPPPICMAPGSDEPPD